MLALLVAEGVWSVSHWRRPHRAWLAQVVRASEPEPLPGEPAAAMVRSEREFEALLDAFLEEGVGLGSSPYRELKTDRSRVNERGDDGILRQRANVRKKSAQIRTHLFEPFDPVTAFWDVDAPLSPEVRAFLDKYAFRELSYTTNEHGERITLPAVDAEDLVLVAGDSIAAGTGVDDAETLASQMQARDASRRYVNLGCNAAHAKDTVRALERAAERYAGRIARLIYLYCENDFLPDEPYGEPEAVIEFLRELVAANAIPDVTVVYAPYTYNVVPQITRFPGSRGDGFPYHGAEKRRLRDAAGAAGFAWLDFMDIALGANRAGRSQFSALALFVDHAHHSPEGIRRLADRLDTRK